MKEVFQLPPKLEGESTKDFMTKTLKEFRATNNKDIETAAEQGIELIIDNMIRETRSFATKYGFLHELRLQKLKLMMKKVFEGICDVCRLIDGNKRIKTGLPLRYV